MAVRGGRDEQSNSYVGVMPSANTDAAELGIAAALFSSIAEEMGVTLGRSAHSPNIKERRDYSCAVFDPQGRLVAQAAHIPVHLGAMPTAVEAAMPLARSRRAISLS